MVESSTSRFRMAGARAAILDGPIAESIEQQIDAIEKRRGECPQLRIRSLEDADRICLQDGARRHRPVSRPQLGRSKATEGDDKSPESITP